MKRVILTLFAALALFAGWAGAGGLYRYAQAQGEAAAAAELDAGAAAVAPGPTVEVSGGEPIATAALPVTTTTTVTTVTTPPSDPVDSVRDVVAGVRTGNWRLAGGAVIAILMLGLRTAREKTRWFSGARGGALLVLLLSFLGSIGAALGTDLPVDLRMLMGALGVAVTAAGGYSVIKGLFFQASDLTAKARAMFAAYNEQGGWKTFDGRTVPPWEDLGDDVRSRWVAAAGAS